MTLTCLRCSNPYPKPRRSFSHYCQPCRTRRDRDKARDRMQRLRDAEREARDQIDEYVNLGMDSEYADRYHERLDDVLDELRTTGTSWLAGDATTPDRMPVGSNSPAGPDDGCSTGWKDLAETLDQRAREAASHQWFVDNPHWAFDLHNPDVDLSKLSGH